MRADVYTLAGLELSRAHMVEEHEWPDVARQHVRQRAPHLEASAEVMFARIDDQDRIVVHALNVNANGVPLAQRCVSQAAIVPGRADTI
jgi:hypothetical protein